MKRYTRAYYSRNQHVLHFLREEFVQYAREHPIKATARQYGIARNTVRRWVRRSLENPDAMLVDARKASHNHPMKMKEGHRLHLINTVKKKRAHGQRVIVAHLKQDLKLPYSVKTLIKALRAEGLWKAARPKKKQKRDLRHVTDRMAFGKCIQVDIKYLTDIPELTWSLRHSKLPKYQITARDRATGALWFAYSREKSTTSTTLFIEHLLNHLKKHGVLLPEVTVQTDNGTEFTCRYQSRKKKSLFENALREYKVGYARIPPACCTFNSAVESAHRLIEDECYGRMLHPKYGEFLEQAAEYQRYFNCGRQNSYRNATPLQLLEQRNTEIDPAILQLRPIEVDTLLISDALNRWKLWQKFEDSS